MSNLFYAEPPSHYGAGIWKQHFISIVRPSVHTNPSPKCRSTKTLFRPGKLKTPAQRVLVKNFLKTELPENDELQLSWFACARELLKHKYNWIAGDCCVFKFLRRSVDVKHLMRFQSETSVFKFLRNSVDRAWVCSTQLGLWDQSFSLGKKRYC